MSDVTDRIPLYYSHKVVRAAPIVAMNPNPHGDGEGTQNDEPYVVLDLGGDDRLFMPVPIGFFARETPPIGAMFVLYDGGYKSWSPRDAFEDGYTSAISAAEIAQMAMDAKSRDLGTGVEIRVRDDRPVSFRDGWVRRFLRRMLLGL